MSFAFSQFPRLEIGGKRVKQITRKSDGLVLWEAGYINMVPLSINADGTIYNGGLGYKDGYRVRSGGAEAAVTTGVCTGFMPFKKGDILRIYPQFSGMNATNSINFFDASFTNLGQYNDNGTRYGICNVQTAWQTIATEVGGVTEVDISATTNSDDIAYIRLTHAYRASSEYISVLSGAELIVTVNEEITV